MLLAQGLYEGNRLFFVHDPHFRMDLRIILLEPYGQLSVPADPEEHELHGPLATMWFY